MTWLTTKLVSAFLLPPLNFLLLGIAGLAVSTNRPRLGRNLVALMLALLWIFSLPVTGNHLIRLLDEGSHLVSTGKLDAQAIVVLGGGARFGAPEYGSDTVNRSTLERLRYAAWLYRRTGLPVLVTGGDPEERGATEAALMQQVLEGEFNVPVRWAEGASNDTLQNAAFSRQMLGPGIHTILLVTHGWHMPRSKRIFEQAGFRVIAAGTGFHRVKKLTVIDFLPNTDGLGASRVFFHEVLGMLRDRIV